MPSFRAMPSMDMERRKTIFVKTEIKVQVVHDALLIVFLTNIAILMIFWMLFVIFLLHLQNEYRKSSCNLREN